MPEMNPYLQINIDLWSDLYLKSDKKVGSFLGAMRFGDPLVGFVSVENTDTLSASLMSDQMHLDTKVLAKDYPELVKDLK